MAAGLGAPARAGITVARSIDEVEAFRPLWERLQGTSLMGDIDYFIAVARHHPEVIRPHVVVVAPENARPAILAGHLTRTRIGHRLGPWTPFRPRAKAISIHRGLVGDHDPRTLALALHTLADELRETADALLLHNLEPDSPLHRVATSVFPRHARQRWSPRKARWESDVGTGAEEAFASRSRTTRENIRRTQRRIERDFGERATIRVFREPFEAEQLFEDVDAIAVKTYQTRFGPIFRDDEFERRLAEVGLSKGWYRAYVLYLDQRPVAFWTGYSYGGVFGWRGVTGYDPAFRRYSVGKYLLTMLLTDLARDRDVHEFSLGPGDIPYKQFFGDRRREEIDVRIFASTPRGIWINVVGSAVHGLQALVGAAREIRAVGDRVDALRARRQRKQRRHAM